MFLFVFCALLCISNAFAQKTFSGTVLGSDGLGLPGVSVVEKANPVNGAYTDIDGKWTLTVPSGNAILELTSIGMKTVEIAAKDAQKITMQEDSQVLDEVVVTGHTKIDKRIFTGATTKLKTENMKIEGLPDIARSLEGRAAGVSVQNVSGTFGSAPKIRIRGATSIYGNSKPLWVVDGVVMEDVTEVSVDALASGDANTLISSAIAGLNPDDIESFDILKDGSATSIYGARAMAGVIVINTKKGKKGSSNVTYNSTLTYRAVPRYSDYNIMNSQEHMSVLQELEGKGNFTISSVANARESGIYGEYYREIANGNINVKNTPEGKAEFLRQAEYRNTNWFKELFQNTVMQTHSVSFSSGMEKATIYGSISAMIDPGWTKSSDVKRYTGNFNTTFEIFKNLKMNVITNASLINQTAPGTTNRYSNPLTGGVSREFDINPFSYALTTSRTLDSRKNYVRNFTDFNILDELDRNYMDINTANLKIQTELSYKLNDNIDFTALAALKYINATTEHRIEENSNQANAFRAGVVGVENAQIRDRNPFLYRDPDNIHALPISILPKGGMLLSKNHKMLGYDLRATASYHKTFDNIHTVNAYVGTEINSVDRDYKRNDMYGVQYDLGNKPSINHLWYKRALENDDYHYALLSAKNRMASFYGTFTYSYDRKYTVNGTMRYEGTNRLGKSVSARWLPTWNISGSWYVSDEDFFEPLRKTVSSLKLKTSYSLTGDRGPEYVSNSTDQIGSYNLWKPYAKDKETVLGIDKLENSELTYEKKTEFNLGLEASFLNNRIGLTFDWYKRNNYDLIGRIITQGVGGETSKMGNVANMKSDGVEFSLSTTNIKNSDFSWRTDFIFSKTSNEITDFKSDESIFDFVRGYGFIEGYSRGALFSVPFLGLSEEGLPMFTNEKGEKTVISQNGVNKYGMVNLQDRKNFDFLKYEGTVDPTIMGSFGNVFKYKNLELGIFTTYAFGSVVRLDPVFSYTYNDYGSLPKELADRWVVPGDEALTTVPVLPDKRTIRRISATNIQQMYNVYNYSSARVAKGDFIRLKDVSLKYDFPKRITEKLNLNRLSMKLQGTNLFLLYADKKLKGQDPEFINSGGVATPLPKQITFTLNVAF